MRRLLCLGSLLLLTACGQKGPLYLPDAGTAVPAAPQASPAPPAPPTAPTSGTDRATTPEAPTPAASPDRSDEARKRLPATPSPAQSK